MKRENERGEELSLTDLELISGGAPFRFIRSDAELARLGRGLQQYASGLLRSPGPRPALLEPRQPADDAAFDLTGTDVQLLRQLAR